MPEAIKDKVLEVKEKPQPKEKRVEELSLPELMANITRRILTVLESGDVNTKQSEINGCRQDLRLWYETKPADVRKEIGKDAKRIMQNFKNVGEQFYSDLVGLTAQDM